MKLDVKSFAMTSALIWGLGLFLLTWWIILFHGSAAPGGEPPFIGLIYLGYRLTPLGSVIGLAWAFVDGWIGGAVFAWLYNALSRRQAVS